MTIASVVSTFKTSPAPITGRLPIPLGARHPRHLHAQWHDCRQTAEGLRHADALKRLCLRLCEELQLEVASNAFFQFEPSGVTGALLLHDSHIALHTWPERNMLKADIYLRHNDPDSAALVFMKRLKACFQPASASINSCPRPARAN